VRLRALNVSQFRLSPLQLAFSNFYFAIFFLFSCDQKLASDSSGLPGGFSGQRAWVRILKNGRQAAIVLSWLLLVQLPGQVL
jgi:hypothetical protein